MKTRLFAALAFALVTLPVLRAEELATNTIKFSDPAKPGTLKIRVGRGDLRLTGADVPEITIKSKSHVIDSKPRSDGLRVLSASSSFGLSEKENVVTLDAVSGSLMGSGSDFTIIAPRNTIVSLVNSWGGDITCADLTGDIDVKSLNGEIHLNRLGGAACVETTNGEIQADIQTLQSGKTYSFTSMNGEVRVQVPGDAGANVRLRTQNGTILTDFDEKALVTKLEMIPRKNIAKSIRTAGRKSDNARTKFEDDTDIDTRVVVHEALQAGAEAMKEAAVVAQEAMRVASDELRNHSRSYDYAPFAPLPPLPPMTGGKIVSGTLNGGGPEIQIATMNGDVTLRKLEEKRK